PHSSHTRSPLSPRELDGLSRRRMLDHPGLQGHRPHAGYSSEKDPRRHGQDSTPWTPRIRQQAKLSYSRGMPAARDELLLRVNAFEVRIGGREVGFGRVSRLTSETVGGEPASKPTHAFTPVRLR